VNKFEIKRRVKTPKLHVEGQGDTKKPGKRISIKRGYSKCLGYVLE
jgi:hypothetical protein